VKKEKRSCSIWASRRNKSGRGWEAKENSELNHNLLISKSICDKKAVVGARRENTCKSSKKNLR